MFGNIAGRWKELNGSNNWAGLLSPGPDAHLRRSVILYGELAQATYDAFNHEKRSPSAGAARYGPANLFARTQVSAPGAYKVTKYLYATSSVDMPEAFMIKSLSREAWSKESNWIGYVAVATDEGATAVGRRDVAVAWRGTLQVMEWMNDLDFGLVSARDVLGSGNSSSKGGGGEAKVHKGWLSVYTSSDPRSKYNKESARKQVTSLSMGICIF